MARPIIAILDRFETLIEAISDPDDTRVSFARVEGPDSIELVKFTSPEDAHRRYQLTVGGHSPRKPELMGTLAIQYERVTVRVSYGMESTQAFDGFREIVRWAAEDYDRIVRALTFPSTPWGSSTNIRGLPDPVVRSVPVDQGGGLFIVDIAFEFLYASP